MKTLPTGLLLAGLLASLIPLPAEARNFAVPANDPAATVTVPDTWSINEIEYGYSAKSPGEDVFFSVESSGKKNFDAMMNANEAWMKENNINGDVQPQTQEMDFNGIKGTVIHFDTTDDNGPTQVEFVMIPGGKNRVIMMTLWGSKAERQKHGQAIDAIMNSVKPIQ